MSDAKTNLSKLPIGVESFRELREGGYRYVDKTMEIGKLLWHGRHYDMARPRGFGKTLLLSTIECLLRGERELFRGLAVEPHWDWSEKRPVVRLNLGSGDFETEDGLDDCLQSQLTACGRRAGISLRPQWPGDLLADLLLLLHRQTGKRVAVLVDDFDRPVLGQLGQGEVAERNCRTLTAVLSNLKAQDEHIRFALLVGASAPYLANIFGGVNHLLSLTTSRHWPTICGFTEPELEAVFAEELAGLDRDRIRERYLGYRWHDHERVYCPWEILQLLKERQYRAWWFEAASPQPMLDLITETGHPWRYLARADPGWRTLDRFNAARPAVTPLLLQTGYLTHTSYAVVDCKVRCEVGYPNAAVRESISEALLRTLWGAAWRKRDERRKLRRALAGSGSAGMAELLRDLLARIRRAQGAERAPREDIHDPGVLYAHFAALGQQVWIDGPRRRRRQWDLCLQAGGRLWAVRFDKASAGGPRQSPSGEDCVASRYGQRGVPGHFFRVTRSRETGEVIGFEARRIRAPAEGGPGIE